MKRDGADDGKALPLFIVVGTVAAVLFTFLTPPFKVPDEVGHFWRAASIAYGYALPAAGPKGGEARLPVGLKTLVHIFWRSGPTPKRADFDLARELVLESVHPAEVTFPAGYTPVPYLPQTIAAFAGRLFETRPVVTFYAGRLLNAMAFVLLVSLAIRAAPQFGWIFCAAALLPMALFMAASWSPDAVTIGASFLLAARLLRACSERGRLLQSEVAAAAAAGALVGMCKGYFFIALLALAIPAARSKRRFAAAAAILGATAAGVALSAAVMLHAGRAQPHPPGVDAAAQWSCIAREPLHFLRLAAADLREHGSDYAEQCVGRLGLLDVFLPRPVFWGELALLLLAAWSCAAMPPLRVRIAAAAVCLVAAAGIAMTLYAGWTAVCAGRIDGIQGRYYLPALPVVLLVIGLPLVRRPRLVAALVAAGALVANTAALAAVASHYYY